LEERQDREAHSPKLPRPESRVTLPTIRYAIGSDLDTVGACSLP